MEERRPERTVTLRLRTTIFSAGLLDILWRSDCESLRPLVCRLLWDSFYPKAS